MVFNACNTASKKDLMKQYKYSEDDVQNLLMYGGLKIYTTMNRKLQDYSQKILNDDKNFGITSSKDKNGIVQPQASAVIMDYHTGQVKVIIGEEVRSLPVPTTEQHRTNF